LGNDSVEAKYLVCFNMTSVDEGNILVSRTSSCMYC